MSECSDQRSQSTESYARSVRPAAVAGMFYPATAEGLTRCLNGLSQLAKAATGLVPDLVIAPHAGYMFSGRVAASAYQGLAGRRFERVVVVAVSHFQPDCGLASSGYDAFQTPLGTVPLDRQWLAPWAIAADERAHGPEYAIEVQLPFLQVTLAEGWQLVPLLVGDNSDQAILQSICEAALAEPSTLLVISSDLSHERPSTETAWLNQQTAQWLTTLSTDSLSSAQACGYRGISAALRALHSRGGGLVCLDLAQSADAGAEPSKTVGYGAFQGFIQPVSDEPAPARWLVRQSGAEFNAKAARARVAEAGYCLGSVADWSEAEVAALIAEFGRPWSEKSPRSVITPKENSTFVAHEQCVIEAHNECAYAADPPRYLILHCVDNQVDGGRFALVDSEAVLADLEPEFWPSLRQAVFRCSPGEQHVVHEGTLLRTTAEGPRLIYTAIGSEAGCESFYTLVRSVDAYSPLLVSRLNTLLSDRRYYQQHDWQTGDLLVIDNWRLLHRRDAFSGKKRRLYHYRVR